MTTDQTDIGLSMGTHRLEPMPFRRRTFNLY